MEIRFILPQANACPGLPESTKNSLEASERAGPSHCIDVALFVFLMLFFKKRFYLFIHEIHTHTGKKRERQRHMQREKQAPCREPDVGLDPRTAGSCPGLKAGAQPLSHPGIPKCI